MLIGNLNVGCMNEIKRLFEAITPFKALQITKIGGMTNTNYLVQSGTNHYVLRIPPKNAQAIINREQEKHIEKALMGESISAKCLYFDSKTGIKITEFINAKTLNFTDMGKHFNALADKLKALHTSKLDFKYHFNPADEMKKYLEFARNSRFWFDELKKGLEPFYHHLEKVKNINQKYFKTEFIFLPTHGDLVPQNILVSGADIRLIDWEYAGLNDPCWDLASFIIECELGLELENEFLLAYGADEIKRQKIKYYKNLVDILWAVWAVAKSDKNTNYIDYAKTRLNAALNRDEI